jgi:membrane protease YdiL (CAAX protease family)
MRPAWSAQDLGLFVGSYLPISLAAALLSRLVPESWFGPAGPLLLSQFLVYSGAIAVIFWLAGIAGLSLRMPVRAVPIALLGGPCLAVLGGLLGAALKAKNIDTPVKDWLSDPRSFLLTCAFIALIAPLAEEVVFRGFFQPFVTARWGAAAGILGVALPFALLHGPTYHWSVPHMAVVAVAGAAFGWMRHSFASTAAAALLHASYNATLLFGYLKQN